MQVTVSTKGQIVIPAAIRKKYGMGPGTKLQVVDLGDHVCLVPSLKDPVNDAWGMFADGPSLTEALLEERAREKAREDAR
jgi:AbrB family looped-hinge helix DNA binding protein